MTTAAHTPGPWRTKTGPGWHDTYIVGELVGAHEPTIATVRVHNNQQHHMANARLIAAAPELLAALEVLLPMFADWHSEFPQHVGDKEAPALQNARAAIAKATGAAA